jgi:hypothetical protein
MPDQVVCVTTFRQGNPENSVGQTRAEVFLTTAQKMMELGLPVVALFTETQENFLGLLERLGVTLVKQQTSGMGAIRREALACAFSLFPLVKNYCWIEPEKPDMVRFIFPMLALMSKEQSLLGLFNRVGMASYPAEQAHYYLFCRVVATKLLGFDIDYAFGPMVISRPSVPNFLEYAGEYGDKWESILVPRLRILNRDEHVSLLSIDFKNDPRMTAIESGNIGMILKRLEQFNNVIPSLVEEWRKLCSV